MTTVFRRIALAAALVVGAGAAQAGVVISFDRLRIGEVVPNSYANPFGASFSDSGAVYDTFPNPINSSSTGHLGNNNAATPVSLSVLNGFIYNIFSFDFSHSCLSGTFNVKVVGQDSEIVSKSWTCGVTSAFVPWQNAELDLTSVSRISTIEFGFSSLGLFGVDNLRLGTRDTGGGGGTVPEPASYGLVAMALLAAGWASRRRAG